MKPNSSSKEFIVDGALHVVGVAAGFIAVLAMMIQAVRSLELSTIASLGIYGVTLLLMFSCSAAYNLYRSSKWTGLLRRLDHAAIFLKIAGTYTPFAVVMGGIAGYLMLGVVWTISLLGAGLKLVSTQWKGFDIPIYLILGWVGVLAVYPLANTFSPLVLALLVLGGALYSIGVVFHVWRNLKYHNAIWHGFVLVATACHFGAVTAAVFG